MIIKEKYTNTVEKNIKEIVLTGIHIGQWGLEWGMTLLDLLKKN